MEPNLGSSTDIAKDMSDHVFIVPERSVRTQQDMQMWERSEAYLEYLGFIQALNEAVQSKPLSVKCSMSTVAKNLVTLLDHLDRLIDSTPPANQPQRFGNQAFRSWHHKLSQNALDLLQSALQEKYYNAIPEVMVYLTESFGNPTRIDYGTGHEVAFLMFLCCLFKISALKQTDKQGIVCKVFQRYLDLVHKLQLTYRMEPAGSHGVWSLDDYQFVPFIWGSSQLIDHPIIEPAIFMNDNIIDQYYKDFMFLNCIDYIRKVKTGLFAEHSNQLWSISGVPSWSKINAGLIKMYKKEVLGKFPVVQHILFGSLFAFRPAKPNLKVRSLRMNILKPPPMIDLSASSLKSFETQTPESKSLSSQHGEGESTSAERLSTNAPSKPESLTSVDVSKATRQTSNTEFSVESEIETVNVALSAKNISEESILEEHASVPSIKETGEEVVSSEGIMEEQVQAIGVSEEMIAQESVLKEKAPPEGILEEKSSPAGSVKEKNLSNENPAEGMAP